MENKLKTKEQFELKFKEVIDLVKSKEDLDPRSKAVAITNLETAKMWAVKSIFDK